MIESATSGDLPEIRALLLQLHLPLGVEEQLPAALMARDGRQVVGTAALELDAEGALLRSVAVEPTRQGRQLRHQLTDAPCELATTHGTRTVSLPTNAERFLPKFGFAPIDHEQVPLSVRESVEFTSVCPASAIVMRKRL